MHTRMLTLVVRCHASRLALLTCSPPALLPLLSKTEHPVCSGQANCSTSNRGCQHPLDRLVQANSTEDSALARAQCQIKHLGLPTLPMCLQPESTSSDAEHSRLYPQQFSSESVHAGRM